MNKVFSILFISVFAFTLASCNDDDSPTNWPKLTALQVCEQVTEKVAKKLQKLGLGGLGMALNTDGTQVEPNESQISRCEGNLSKFASDQDLSYLSGKFIPCFESAIKVAQNGSDIEAKSCINSLGHNMTEKGALVFKKYVLLPLFEESKLPNFFNE